ncbi:MAG: HEAT repeat domain-containing protein [Thermoguttaceae bacterium]
MSDSEQAGCEDLSGHDSRTNEELISTALSHTYEDDSYWDVVWTLHRRDTPEVLSLAETLSRSSRSAERRLGADILGQLGSPERTYPKQCMTALLEMLKEENDVVVLRAILIALGHLGQPEAIGPALEFRTHPDPGVRNGVVMALMGHEVPLAVEGLVELSKDEDSHNRDWATFGLGSQIQLDTPLIRKTLIDRLNDVDFDTRREAIAGLTERRDRQVIPVLVQELTSDCVSTLAVEAAAAIAAPELLPHLLALKERWDIDPALLAQAIQACSPASNNEVTTNQEATE